LRTTFIVVVIICGGGLVACTVTGGLGNVVVKAGNSEAAVGAVALPLLYWGCTTPASDGGTAAGTIGGVVVIEVPSAGGGKGGVNVGSSDAAVGEVALPLLNTG
jgi:hypothetical protein